ncbi:glutamate receptor-like [Macrobrachium rosenbergii]|uniref:glutamate receptor-like n=1 Tax=Macrobrachium rosenbergii TaxID=79674 RepID=UPI0034D7A01B
MDYTSWFISISFLFVHLIGASNATGASPRAVAVKYDWKAPAWDAVNSHRSMQFSFPRAPHFRVAAEEWPPHVYIRTDIEEGSKGRSPQVMGKTVITGPMGKLMDELAHAMNFTYSVVQGDGYWGAPQGNGSWNGMIGTVLRGEADIGLGPFGMSYTRSQVVDFTIPVFIEMLHVIVQRPLPMPDPWGFVAPFTWFIWVGLLVAMVAIMIISFAITNILGFGGPRSLWKHFWATYSVAFSQTFPWKPNGLALQMTCFIWAIVIFIVTRSYSGALTSLLAVKNVPVKYDSLRDVLDDKTLNILMEGSTALTAHLQTVQSGIYYELAKASLTRAKYVKASETYGAAYSLIPKGHYAMLVENVVCRKIYSDYFSLTGRCDFYMSTGNFWQLIYAMIVSKGSPLRELMNVRIQSITESGIYEKWAIDQMPNMTHCLKMPTKVKAHEPYSLLDLWALFMLVGGGLVLATLVFACEFLSSSAAGKF